jgi:sulfate transport system ATP-binding protein
VNNQSAIAYVRPHDIELASENSEGSIPATISHVSTAGSVLRIELKNNLSDDVIHVELPRSQERSLNLSVGANVFAKPTNSKVFLQD